MKSSPWSGGRPRRRPSPVPRRDKRFEVAAVAVGAAAEGGANVREPRHIATPCARTKVARSRPPRP